MVNLELVSPLIVGRGASDDSDSPFTSRVDKGVRQDKSGQVRLALSVTSADHLCDGLTRLSEDKFTDFARPSTRGNAMHRRRGVAR
jgi:hypothetical protein